MSDTPPLRRAFDTLGRALDRLEEALAAPDSAGTLVVDGTIQRFEFAIELFWKALKRQLAAEGVEAVTPKAVLSAAWQAGWLAAETPWLDMLRDRNRTSHTYDEALAREIYARIRGYAPVMRETYARLAARAASAG